MTLAMSGLNGHGMNGAPAHDSDEHVRLELEIAAAKLRTAAAKERAAAIDAQVQADMRQELVASRETVEEMERNHAAAIALIREAAQAEVDRILDEARQKAAAASEAQNAG